MRLVIVESPYAGEIERNTAYARLCVRDSLEQGEAPIASHLLYTQPLILDEFKPEERAWGIQAGLAWSVAADLHAFYIDFGWSNGMRAAMEHCQSLGKPTSVRMLPAAALEKLLLD